MLVSASNSYSEDKEISVGFCSAVRHGSHQGGSLQNGLRNEQTYRTTLASAYMLHHLSAIWLQLQMMGRSLRWK